MSEDCPGHEITDGPFNGWRNGPHPGPLQQTVTRDPIVRGLENILVEVKAIRIALERGGNPK